MKKYLILPLMIMAFFGCKNENLNEQEHQEETVIQEEEHHHEENKAIVLDNGKKWVVVPEMMAFIKNIKNGVIEFTKKETTTFEDHKNLSKLIDENLKNLTSSCTMTGQAHDELHKWLLPFLDLSTEYSEASKIEQAQEAYHKINESFKEFNIYFE